MMCLNNQTKEVNIMQKKSNPKLFGLHADPPKYLKSILIVLPFLLFISMYLVTAEVKHKENPRYKLLPTVEQMVSKMNRVAFSEDKRTGKIIFIQDTISSLKRLGSGLLISTIIAFLLGLNMGLFPGFRNLLLPFITVFSNIPPLAILPILFIFAGQGDFAKILLIVIGTFAQISRDICYTVMKIPREMIVKSLTLGASQMGVAYRVIVPQTLPRLIEDVRLQLGAAWLFLIAAESISANSGLGYRIFLMIRYLAMDLIIPYVLWITLLAITFDFSLKYFSSWKYEWYHK